MAVFYDEKDVRRERITDAKVAVLGYGFSRFTFIYPHVYEGRTVDLVCSPSESLNEPLYRNTLRRREFANSPFRIESSQLTYFFRRKGK